MSDSKERPEVRVVCTDCGNLYAVPAEELEWHDSPEDECAAERGANERAAKEGRETTYPHCHGITGLPPICLECRSEEGVTA